MTHDWSQLQKPIYNSKKGNKFDTWVPTLTGYLTSKVSEKVSGQKFNHEYTKPDNVAVQVSERLEGMVVFGSCIQTLSGSCGISALYFSESAFQ